MIELTVRTLDSQNHAFTVEDDITVEQFKVKIAETVNIPPETQRIIYCGRILNDSSKLSDYDVNGKVVHLVQRKPPNQNQRPSRTASPQRQRRGLLRGFEHGNAMYLGSMAFPSNLMESQGFVPPPPTHSLAGSRLNVAKRMLRRAEAVIGLLENPSARPTDHSPPEENQEEEVTPVIEARVIVPNNANEPIDEAMVLSVVQNSLFNAAGGSVPITREENDNNPDGPPINSEQTNDQESPGSSTPRESSTENLTDNRGDNATNGNGNVLAENASRTSEMAELLTMLGQLQTRFAPFLDRYLNFMQEDPVVPTENVRQTQVMLSRVSEVMHFFSHAYHSLSDIIIRVRTPPPRPLLCRPILIQHSAVVQAGIPIQVEAQINLSTDRPPTNATGASTNSSSTSDTASNRTSMTHDRPNTTTSSPSAPTISTTVHHHPEIVGSFPFIPAMRVQSFPVEIRAMARPAGTTGPTSQNNNNTANEGENASRNVPPTTSGSAAASTASSSNSLNFNNSNVEFFMEVTPEGITIDSMETALVGPNQANDLLRGALNGPPPELLQSLMQMAGQIMDRSGVATTSTATSEGNAQSNSSTQSNQSTVGSSQATPQAGQNSQARGNTQTNPTTATHTRSTSRPHVHLAQQAMQAGFDPFLPCNSHHVTPRRTVVHTHPNPNQNETASRQENGSRTSSRPARPQPNIYNFISDILSSIRTAQNRRVPEQTAAPSAPAAAAAAATSSTSTNTQGPSSTEGINIPMPPIASLFTNTQGQNLSDFLRHGPTVFQILQQFQQDESYVPGESIITDLVMLLFRNLTLVDLCTLNSGCDEPINRSRNDIQTFFRTRVLDNDSSPEGINRGVERIMNEMRPFFENFSLIPIRDNIDIIRSAETLFRNRLPVIINIAINLNSTSVRSLIDECLTTLKHLCALIIRACSNGQPGVEQVFEQVMERYLEVPPEVQHWTFISSRVHLRQFLANLSVPDSTIQQYIVYKNTSEAAAPTETIQSEVRIGDSCAQPVDHVEAMELDDHEQEASGSGTEMEAAIIVEDNEPLPNIVLGSEPWHAQVPADWVPIIARDAQKQRRQNGQGPFSDAYLSGMPSKRRKIVNSSKPQGSLPQVISESIRQAVTSTGLATAAPLESVVQAAGESIEIQTAYRNLLRTSVQASLRDNEDFTPERYPNTSNYFNNPQQ